MSSQTVGNESCRTYEFIEMRYELDGFSPPIREIAEYLGKGSSTVFYQIKRLASAGWIERKKIDGRACMIPIKYPRVYYRKLND